MTANSPLGPEPQVSSDSDRLIAYSDNCYATAMSMHQRLVFRGRLIVISTSAILTVTAALLGVNVDKISENYPKSFTALSIAFVIGTVGLFRCTQASYTYLLHGEEDTGTLPNPVSFGRIGRGWWLTQPTVDTVEERYLPRALLLSLRWTKAMPRWLQPIRNTFHHFRLSVSGATLDFRVRSLASHLRKYPCLRTRLQEEYRLLLQYDDQASCLSGEMSRYPISHGIMGIRDRGPTDLSYLISFIIMADIDRSMGRPSDIELRTATSQNHAKNVLSEFRRRIKNSIKVAYRTRDSRTETHPATVAAGDLFIATLGLPDSLQGRKNKNWTSDFIYQSDIDILHHPIFVRSPGYYQQLSEEFALREIHSAGVVDGIGNATGSMRPFSILENQELKKLKKTKQGHTRVSWRILVSTYFAAQDQRSANWNTWYRVKSSERLYIEGLCWVLFSLMFTAIVIAAGSAGGKDILENQSGPEHTHHSGPPVYRP